jgi:phosphoribosylanthranilate isomerase
VLAKIKSCGIMQGQDVAVPVEGGGAYPGVVFASGPRTVNEEQEEGGRIPGRMVLAGGPRPDNVGAVLARVRPQIVDVISGVEHRPRIKDPHEMKQFMEAVVAHSTVT